MGQMLDLLTAAQKQYQSLNGAMNQMLYRLVKSCRSSGKHSKTLKKINLIGEADGY